MTRRSRIALVAGSAILLFAAGCGDDDFENKPRPAVPVALSGVIQADKVTVSPDGTGRMKVGAGPILLTVANETDEAHTVILEGEAVREQVGPINPLDTAKIQKTLARGTYEVRAGSDKAQRKQIEPAELVIGPPRKSSNDELLLP